MCKQLPMNKTEIGCIFLKNGQYGEYLSIKIEIDGKTHNFTAFQSKHYVEGDNKPKYYIPAPRIQSNDVKLSQPILNTPVFVTPKKADVGAMMKDAGLLDQDDLPF